MKPKKIGQIVRFCNPLTKEESVANFIIKEIFFDVEKPRAIVRAINSRSFLSSTHVYFVDDLEVIEEIYAFQ